MISVLMIVGIFVTLNTNHSFAAQTDPRDLLIRHDITEFKGPGKQVRLESYGKFGKAEQNGLPLHIVAFVQIKQPRKKQEFYCGYELERIPVEDTSKTLIFNQEDEKETGSIFEKLKKEYHDQPLKKQLTSVQKGTFEAILLQLREHSKALHNPQIRELEIAAMCEQLYKELTTVDETMQADV